ncbi:hypothetical protein K2173_025384 [Erythroxylum novogranatense]|uniref:RING-type E3 ubiquitin transferase n=1 Tax=Erythroxylum novogranatense TaxID=1862640 RepID=A0AAV8UHC4_9ROSI|nr:hypothetical protein K2173_025384 [Erythroxylum novogranatense]
MNDLSSEVVREQNKRSNWNPVPSIAIYITVPLFFIGLSVSVFILVVVHNVSFFLSFLFLSAFVITFIAWNTYNWRHKAAVICFLHSFPDSDLGTAREGQLVKITGLASCGSTSLESSYERASRCVYASTLLYEYGRFGLTPSDSPTSWFGWTLTFCERFSTDFFITDQKSGIRATVKAGSGYKVVPLVVETNLVSTTRQCRILSPHLRKWLQERNLSTEARVLRLEEGYVQEGSFVTVIGVLRRNNDILMIVQPQELLSTGCLWQKLLLPVDIDGLVLGVPNIQTLQQGLTTIL